MLNGQEFDISRYQNMPLIATKLMKPVEILNKSEIKPVEPEPTPNDSGDASGPVSDNQKEMFNSIRHKIIDAFKEG